MKKHFTNKSQMNMKFTAAIVATALQLVVALLQLHYTHGYDSAAYKDPHYVGRRTTMVHLFEWKFKDIAVECERFLGPTGYAAVQVSPVSECLILENRPWFERYQPISYKLISRSGNEAEFKDMVARCNRVGVRIYVDAVINHMTSNVSPARGTGDSTADPWQKKYPAVPYGPNDFHRTCAINNYQNASEVRNCELSGLHDLDQSSSYVRGKIVEFLNRVIDLGVAGLRIDGAKHMWPKDLEHIYANLHNLSTEFFPPNKRPFIYQEVIDVGLGEAVSKYEYNYLGTVIEFVFGIVLGRSFNGVDPLKEFEHWGPDRGLLPSGDAVVMVDNHDNQRGHGAGGEYILTYKKQRLYLMAVAFMLAHPYGHPRVMSSFNFSDPSQGPPATKNGNIISPDPVTVNIAAGNVVNSCNHGWVCEHRWAPISNMVQFRNLVQDAPLANWWSNGHNQIAFSRRNLGFVAFNGEYGKDLRQKLMIGLPAGKYCDVISGRKEGKECTGKSVTVNADGTANVELLKDEPHGVLAIHVESKLQ